MSQAVVSQAQAPAGGVPTHGDRALGALRLLLRSSHHASADDLPQLASSAGTQLGASRTLLYLVDYDQLSLVPLTATGGPGAAPAEPVAIEGTLAGRAFADIVLHTSNTDGCTMWIPVLDGTERLGLLQLDFPSHIAVDEELRDACLDVAALLAELVMTRSLYGDAVERARRGAGMTVPAELQRRLLPPLTFISPRVAVAGALAPAKSMAGDSFDYALNGDTMHVAIVDAMGHGLEATLLSAVAIATLRNARRSGLDLLSTVRVMDAEIASQFGPDRFVTGIVGELDVSTGWWRWTTCGHPPALLVRGGRAVKTLDSLIGPPLGLGLLRDYPDIGQERLEPGDRLVLYTDGVTEARNAEGQFFGTTRLVEFLSKEEAAGRPAAETLRRLILAILGYQEGTLQDDATTVMVEWPAALPERSTP